MPRTRTSAEALTPGQLARRWGIAVDRVRRLIHSGQLPGTFLIPSSGRYGEAVRIPLVTILQAEQAWTIAPTDVSSRPRRQRARQQRSPSTLKNFPELSASPLEHDAGCREGALH